MGVPPAEPKKSNTTLIIIIAVVVVLCCCTLSVLGILYTYGDQIMHALGVY